MHGADMCPMHGGPGLTAYERTQDTKAGVTHTSEAGIVARAAVLAASLSAQAEAEALSAREADSAARDERSARLAAALSRARTWTVPRLDAALAHLRAGAPFREACHLVHGSPDALRHLMASQPDVLGEVEAARAHAMATLRRAMETADRDEWKRYAWLLERLSPQDYAPPKVVEVQGSASAPPVRVALSLDQAVKLASELEEGEGG